MAVLYLFKVKMAGKILILALALSICKVQSQSIGCCSPSSNSQSSCGPSQSQMMNGLKASPQLQFVPGQNFNLQAIPLSQFSQQSQGSQGSNIQKAQSAINVPKQSFQVSSSPQISSSFAQPSNVQCSQPYPQVITAPVSTITIPSTGCTTAIDDCLANTLANALQMMIANDFINSVISNNIINQDSLSIPVVETSVPSVDLNSFIRNLNANQLAETQTAQYYEPEETNDCYNWENLLNYLNEDKKAEPEPENKYDAFFKYLKGKGQTVDQITKQPEAPIITACVQNQDDDAILQALAKYFGNNCDTSPKCGNAAQVVFPEEIPAQLICNYGYIPTTTPVVSFSVQPLDPNCNFIVGAGGQIVN
ncbi:uncharacterized protein LOC134802606 [Cydia splendana]|uniref:uncharacterized protein LOC134802606 n=1 Tax=Cydia splendana TaxID=1100963 RepID=UPI00300C0A92